MIALGGLIIGLFAWGVGRSELAWWAWAAGTVPVVAGLLISMIRGFLAGRMGVDAVAFVSMSGALALGETLAGAVVAVMYAGGKKVPDWVARTRVRVARTMPIRTGARGLELDGCTSSKPSPKSFLRQHVLEAPHWP